MPRGGVVRGGHGKPTDCGGDGSAIWSSKKATQEVQTTAMTKKKEGGRNAALFHGGSATRDLRTAIVQRTGS